MKTYLYEIKFKEVNSVVAKTMANSKEEAKKMLMNMFVQHYNDMPPFKHKPPEMGKKYNESIETMKKEGCHFGIIVNKKDICFLDER